MNFSPVWRGFALAILAALLVLLPVASAQAATGYSNPAGSVTKAFWFFVAPWLARWAPEKLELSSVEASGFDAGGPPVGVALVEVGSAIDPAGKTTPGAAFTEVGADADPAGQK